MRIRVLAIAALLLAVPAPGPADPGDPPQSCTGVFVTRGACLLTGSEGETTYSISGTGYGADRARIQVRLEDALTGEVLARCSAERSAIPAEVTCQRTVTVAEAPFVGLCVAEGLAGGRFYCDAL